MNDLLPLKLASNSSLRRRGDRGNALKVIDDRGQLAMGNLQRELVAPWVSVTCHHISPVPYFFFTSPKIWKSMTIDDN